MYINGADVLAELRLANANVEVIRKRQETMQLMLDEMSVQMSTKVEEDAFASVTKGVVYAGDIEPLSEMNSVLQQCVESVLSARASGGADWAVSEEHCSLAKTTPTKCKQYPAKLENGEVHGLGDFPGSIRVLECNDDYSIEGSTGTVVCHADGKWSDGGESRCVAGTTTAAIGVRSDKLIAAYTFDGDYKDKSGNENNGKATSGISLTTDRHGKSNNAGLFKSSGLLRIPHSTIGDPGGSWTLAVWIFITSASGTVPLVAKAWEGGNGYFIEVSNSNIEAGWGRGRDVTYTGGFSHHKWHHVALTYDQPSGKTILYIDGKDKGSTTRQDSRYSTSDFLIGNQRPPADGKKCVKEAHQCSNQPFTGKLDDVLFYSVALSAGEVMELYKS